MMKTDLTEHEIALIDEAIKRTALVMFTCREKQVEDCYKETLRRLEAFPIIKSRIEQNKGRLETMQEEKALPGHSKSIVRFSAYSQRVSPEDAFDAVLTDLEAHIAADTYEVAQVEDALQTIQDDPYCLSVVGRYIQKMTDDEIALDLFCDTSTVRRNRGRLVHLLAVQLYGALAI